jgi:hypothetical protein
MFFGLLVDLGAFVVLAKVVHYVVRKYRPDFLAFKDHAGKYGRDLISIREAHDFGAPLRTDYETIDDLKRALRDAGVESSDLLVFIDFTKSNVVQGEVTFGGRSLHEISDEPNPYEDVIQTIASTLGAYDDDGQIPVFGFGDLRTKNRSVFQIGKKSGMPLDELLDSYRSTVARVELCGPTSFAPCIAKAAQIAKDSYHIALIITDGSTLELKRDLAALKQASQCPISFVIVGVGDGPFGRATQMDDAEGRVFDNLNFVSHADFCDRGARKNDAFVLHALKEIPEQYRMIQALGYLSDS